jgi:prolyl-tRNA synthetase
MIQHIVKEKQTKLLAEQIQLPALTKKLLELEKKWNKYGRNSLKTLILSVNKRRLINR